ncbi:MAG: endonuclease/exonuclease/phosphatase family protein [Bacteroidales bacterium]|nr:endonuclease/exonuclease/phosphatase family protein [Bacteroidales bacterium]
MKSRILIIPCLLAGMLFFACTQKEEPEPVPSGPQDQEETIEPGNSGEYSYTFILKNEGDEGTKSTFENNYVKWTTGDQIAAFASTSKNKYTDVEIDDVSGNVTMTIRSTVALSAGDMVYAYAPYNKVNNEAEATAITLEIPRNQVSGTAAAMPMAALPFELTGPVDKYTDTEVGTLQFMNLGSVIKLNIYKSSGFAAGEKIENVTFQAGAACAGSFTYNLTSVDADNMPAISGYTENDVVVSGNGASPVTVGNSKENGAVFYMVVAPGTYGGTYVIRTSTGDYTYVSGSSREYKRATIKPLNLDLSSANWTPVMGGYDNSIDSPRELAAFLAGTSSSDTGTYNITADLDMTGYTITSASGFGGTLNGNDHVISNITSSVPLFAEISGSVSNLTLDGTCAFTPAQTVTEFGALAALDNGGTYTNVNNAASITITATENITNNIALGGLIGASNNASGSTFDHCSNSGAITIDATAYSHWAVAMAGIVGWTRKSTFDYCTNSGPVSLYAQYGDGYSHQWSFISSETTDTDGNISVAGICGRALDHEKTTDVKSSYNHCENLAAGAITLNHGHMDALPKVDKTGCLNVAGICGQSNGSMESCVNYAPITAIAICPANNDYWSRRPCLLKVGGVAGLTWEGLSINSCSNRGAINVNYDGSWDDTTRNMSAVGGIIGKQGYGLSNAKVTFSTNRGPITVTGNSHITVGGITGSSGSMRGCRVYDTAPINVRCKKGYVGGLLGFADGSSQYQHIRTSYCEADITAENIWNTDRSVVSVGGLIGYFATGATGSYPSLVPYSSDSQRCHYTGNIVSTSSMKVGMVIGWIGGNNEKVFGTSETPILVTGTIHRWGYDYDNAMSEPLTIHAGNVEDYAIGSTAGTVNIYVTSETAAPANLNLMSFNIREGSNWSDRKSPIVSMINGESPDIIGLQEVKDLDVWDLATEGKHPWNYLTDNLSAYTGYRYSDKSNAILYKTSTVELSDIGHFWLRDSYSSEGTSWDGYERTALYATVREKATGRYFFYVTTHFPMNDSNSGFSKATALVESRIAALNTNNYPVILMGDFNCVIGNACWDSIKSSMNNTRYSAASIVSEENQNLYTYNAFGDTSKDRNKVDHIWVSKSITVDSYVTLTSAVRNYGGYTTNGETFLSDHYPIIAHIS